MGNGKPNKAKTAVIPAVKPRPGSHQYVLFDELDAVRRGDGEAVVNLRRDT
jgi:hypothetical protein